MVKTILTKNKNTNKGKSLYSKKTVCKITSQKYKNKSEIQ